VTASKPQPSDERLVAIDKIRDTTRWLILAFAAIGVAVAGTAPLSNIGKLGIHDWRLSVAAAAATAAFVAIAAAIWVATKVWAPAATNLGELVADAELRTIFTDSFELLKGHGTNLESAEWGQTSCRRQASSRRARRCANRRRCRDRSGDRPALAPRPRDLPLDRWLVCRVVPGTDRGANRPTRFGLLPLCGNREE
jgi:hypothetical protein